MRDFRSIQVWQRSYSLALKIYPLTETFPAGEQFGLTSQIRRAAVSIPTNVAEGSKRKSKADFARFLNIAEGSAAEVSSLLSLSTDLGYADKALSAPLLGELEEISRMLYTYRLKVEGD